MSVTVIAAAVTLLGIIVAAYSICYTMNRQGFSFDDLFDQWWGLPTLVVWGSVAYGAVCWAVAELIVAAFR